MGRGPTSLLVLAGPRHTQKKDIHGLSMDTRGYFSVDSNICAGVVGSKLPFASHHACAWIMPPPPPPRPCSLLLHRYCMLMHRRGIPLHRHGVQLHRRCVLLCRGCVLLQRGSWSICWFEVRMALSNILARGNTSPFYCRFASSSRMPIRKLT